jgi:hypothetical protein
MVSFFPKYQDNFFRKKGTQRMSNKVFRPFVEKLGGSSAQTFIGDVGELFYDPTTKTLRISDGETPGGQIINEGGGGGGDANTGDVKFDGSNVYTETGSINFFSIQEEDDTEEARKWSLDSDGKLNLPNGGYIKDGVYGDDENPTIELMPAAPDTESQKLVVKGGAPTYTNEENGITISTYYLNAANGDTVSFMVSIPSYPNTQFYWWVDGFGDGSNTHFNPDTGTITTDEYGNENISIEILNSDLVCRIFVADTLYNAYANNLGAVSTEINGEPVPGSDYHLHLTTANLQETSIVLGTDDHNVRTVSDGGIELVSYNYDYEETCTLKFKDETISISSAYDGDYTNFYIKGGEHLFLDAYDNDVHLRASDEVRIKPGYDFEENDYPIQWTFSYDSGDNIGQFNFPDGTTQTTAWAGGRFRWDAPTSSIGDVEDKIRDVFFDTNYFYYCTANYDGTSNIWKRIEWSANTW